jgi:hypothetical protein
MSLPRTWIWILPKQENADILQGRQLQRIEDVLSRRVDRVRSGIGPKEGCQL